MSLLKSGLLNAIAVMVRVGVGLILNKILAVFVGPAGYALIGQFQSFINMGAVVAGGGVAVGVTKYTAEYRDNEAEQKTFWRTAAIISTACASVTAVSVIYSRKLLAVYFLKDAGYSDVFAWFGITVIFLAWNGLLLAVLNGLKQLRKFITISILGSLIGLVFTAALVVLLSLRGALIALAINQSIVFAVAMTICRGTEWFSFKSLRGNFDKKAAKKLLGFAAMSLVSAIVVPGSQILIRNHLAGQFGWAAVGYWQAVTRISDIYLTLITTTLSFYYLPRLSEIAGHKELKDEIINAYKYLLPLSGFFALLVYLFRAVITKSLFSVDFLPMEKLFLWQLVGDVMKIGSWLLAYLMLAKAMTRYFVITEIVFSLSLVGLTVLFTSRIGLIGAMVAFAVNYFFYWIVVSIISTRVFAKKDDR